MLAVQELRADFRSKKRALLATISASVASTRAVGKTLTQLSKLADSTLRALWEQAGMRGACALLAVGGFGRAKLFPHSDVDVLLLLPDDAKLEDDARLRSRIETFIGSCWDTGLEIGSSVRTVSQCLAESEKDVTVQTSVLESRLVIGDRRLNGQLRERLGKAMDPKAFFVARRSKCASATASSKTRRMRWNPTARNRLAVCATCRCCCGYPRPPAWAGAGTNWPAPAWPPLLRSGRSSATRH